MKISQTISLVTWSLFQELSILASIKKKSGEKVFLVNQKSALARIAKKFLPHALLKKLPVNIAHKPVEKPFISRLASVGTAVKNLWLEKTPNDTFVLDSAAHFIKKKKVYNINVKNVHNYYLSGINLANCDEELPVDLYDELKMRLAGTNGYFHMVFTATLGQEFWWKSIECIGQDQEMLKTAFKTQVSMYDCLKYIDGSKAPWTRERIQEVVDSCKSPEEVQRRVYGRFVKDSGRKYHAFSPSRHYVKPFQIPQDWPKYVGVDPGSGGQSGHPTGIVFIAVEPNYKKGYVYKAWRGDSVETTAGDVFEKYKVLRGTDLMTMQVFDHAAKDFGTIAARNSESFVKAEKSHALGEEIVNTLFRNDMLMLFDDDPEIAKLGSELLSLQGETPKQKAKDDLCDGLRYPAVLIPWDFTAIKGLVASRVEKKVEVKPWTEEDYKKHEIEQRRGMFLDPRNMPEGWDYEIEGEIGYWNEEYGN